MLIKNLMVKFDSNITFKIFDGPETIQELEMYYLSTKKDVLLISVQYNDGDIGYEDSPRTYYHIYDTRCDKYLKGVHCIISTFATGIDYSNILKVSVSPNGGNLNNILKRDALSVVKILRKIEKTHVTYRSTEKSVFTDRYDAEIYFNGLVLMLGQLGVKNQK